MATGVSARLTPAEGRKFGLLIGGAFLLIAAGLAVPTRLGPVYHAWMALAKMISKVTTPVFMGVIFFLVLAPAGFLLRLLGHRPLSQARGAATYWRDRPAGARRGEMDHQF